MENQIIEFDEDGKIEEQLLEVALYDPIGFRKWHKEFKIYVEKKLIEEVEKLDKKIKLLKSVVRNG